MWLLEKVLQLVITIFGNHSRYKYCTVTHYATLPKEAAFRVTPVRLSLAHY